MHPRRVACPAPPKAAGGAADAAERAAEAAAEAAGAWSQAEAAKSVAVAEAAIALAEGRWVEGNATNRGTEGQAAGDAGAGEAAAAYAALAAALGTGGLLLGAFAPQAAAAGLALGAAPPGGAAALVGCFGASLLRAASVCWAIKVAADAGQLATWRVQRLNAALALSLGLTALLPPLAGWGGAAPAAAVLLAAACGAAAVAAGRALARLRPLRGGVAFAATGGPSLGGIGGAVEVFLDDANRTAASLPACLAAALSATAAAGAVLALAPPPPPPTVLGGAAAAYARAALAPGLLLLTAQAAALVEAAQDVRRWTPMQAVKHALAMSDMARFPPAEAQFVAAARGRAVRESSALLAAVLAHREGVPAAGVEAARLVLQEDAERWRRREQGQAQAQAQAQEPVVDQQQQQQQHPEAQHQTAAAPSQQQQQRQRRRRHHLPPGTAPLLFFSSLHLGLFASLAMQGAWLLAAPPSVAALNVPDPVWALQYWPVLLGSVYLAATLFVVGWGGVWDAAIRALGAAGNVLAVVLGLTFVDWEWIADVRR